jgi:integrase
MKVRRMPVYSTGPNGERVRTLSEKWYGVFADFAGVLRRLPLLADRKASDEIARKVSTLNDLAAAGQSIPPDLSRWIETAPAAIVRSLAAWSILPASRVTSAKALAEHIDDWRVALVAKGNTERHAELVTSRARKAFAGAGFKFWNDLSAAKLANHLAGLRDDHKGADGAVRRGISAQTFNFYLQACKQFCRWMMKERRASESPIAHLDGLNVRTDRRHDRRALSADELRALLASTAAAPERFGMTGPERALCYRLAAESGLRAGEIRSLTRSSFELSSDSPSVTVAAAYSKRRREDVQPIPQALADLLAVHLAGKLPAAPAFKMPGPSVVVDMFKADLSEARRTWLESLADPAERRAAEGGTFLAYQDAAGRYADFHALRHTYVCNLAGGGVHPKTAQQLARHSQISLTMDRYGATFRGDTAAALAALPDLTTEPAQQVNIATGTTDVAEFPNLANLVSPGLSLAGGIGKNPMESGGVFPAMSTASESNEKPLKNGVFQGDNGEGGIRTRDTGLSPYNGLANRQRETATPDKSKTSDAGQNSLSPDLSVGAPSALPADPELVALVKAWPDLSAAVRGALVAMATAAAGKAKPRRR